MPLFFRKSIIKKKQFVFEDIAKKLARRELYGFYKKSTDVEMPYLFNFPMDTSVSGCPVTAALIDIFGENWVDTLCETYTLAEGKSRLDIVNDIWHVLFFYTDEAKLAVFGKNRLQLNDEDAKMLLDLLMEFKKQGLTSIIITHKLNEIIYCADRCTILRDGSTIETLTKGVDDLSEDRIIKGMVGRPMEDRYPKREHNVSKEVMLEVKNWTVHHPLYPEKIVDDNISFKVHKGEVVGFSGLQGAGRTELAMSIFGKSYGLSLIHISEPTRP